jgi:maltooligosyltrehalose trehalohydrolase
MTALLLLMPGTPMLFQGQEFGATTPFLYFADHEGDLAEAVRKGRASFVTQFPSLATPEAQARLPVPDDRATFEASKLRWNERAEHVAHLRLHADLIALRSEVAAAGREGGLLDGAVLADSVFALRYGGSSPGDERLLIVNLGPDIDAPSFPEPLLAPPDGYGWRMRWSSEGRQYGGDGAYDVVTRDGWRVPGRSATLLHPVEIRDGGARRS